MKKYFLSGLATLLPLAVTIYVIEFLMNFLTRPFLGIVIKLFAKFPFFGVVPLPVARFISQILILFVLFAMTVLVGAIARWFFIKTLIWIGDGILYKIPF